MNEGRRHYLNWHRSQLIAFDHVLPGTGKSYD